MKKSFCFNLKFNTIRFLLLSSLCYWLGCRNGEIQVNHVQQENAAFYEDYIQQHIRYCTFDDNTLQLHTINDGIKRSRMDTLSNQVVNLAINDTIFGKTSGQFSSYYILKTVQPSQLTFDYHSQFTSNLFGLRKMIIETGTIQINCNQ